MKILLLPLLAVALFGCHTSPVSNTIRLGYEAGDIQKQFDTLYNYQRTDSVHYNGFLEQALANCHDSAHAQEVITQQVFSSMYFNHWTGVYDCLTNTVFTFPGGSITAMGTFVLPPTDSTIAPDHDFPITGGNGAYENISGIYTRHYHDSIYSVELRYYHTNNR
jgi:hypothetical protein